MTDGSQPDHGAASASAKIAVVIPCYKVKQHIMDVLQAIGPEVSSIYVVDDKCVEQTGQFVQDNCSDPRVRVLFHPVNLGVGGAVITGYKKALIEGADVIVKIDGDGQMDPRLIELFVAPILFGEADYTKGNRFFDLNDIRRMPSTRILGNAALSFFTKLSGGYWHIFDPTNGYTAIHALVAARLPLEKINNRYFFESDMLFRLNTIRAAVVDVPMTARYENEKSSLKISSAILTFTGLNLYNTGKRIFYNYFLRDFSLASIELIIGIIFILFGTIFGLIKWWQSAVTGLETTAGTVMLAALPVLAGLQFLLAFLGYDIANTPRRPLHPLLKHRLRTSTGFKSASSGESGDS
jgi:glycosyltransferase involved in cell wall biosynthesis